MDGVGMPGASPRRLGVVARWVPFIRINLVVAAMSDFPVKKNGPDRPDGMPLRGALDDRLDLRSCDPGSEQADERLQDDDGCGDNSNRWGLAEPAKGMRDFWGQRPERHQPQEDEEHAH